MSLRETNPLVKDSLACADHGQITRPHIHVKDHEEAVDVNQISVERLMHRPVENRLYVRVFAHRFRLISLLTMFVGGNS